MTKIERIKSILYFLCIGGVVLILIYSIKTAITRPDPILYHAKPREGTESLSLPLGTVYSLDGQSK